MNSPHVYDKAKYHIQSIIDHGLSDECAENHAVVILRWLIENDLLSDFFVTDAAHALASYRAGKLSIHELYHLKCDCCLIDDMLSDKGNAFAMHYFDFAAGPYISDYIRALKGNLPSEFHIKYNEANYQKMKRIIDRAYKKWQKPKRWWWPF